MTPRCFGFVVLFAAVAIAEPAMVAGPERQLLPPGYAQADLEHGKALYLHQCRRCHGTDGDDITCSGDMTPLAGIARRARIGLGASFQSPSYFTRGVTFEGPDARDLTAFLFTLRGEKGFDDPGLLYMPRLLSKKYPLLKHYRLLDVRDRSSYAAGHIPNALRWEKAFEDLESAPRAGQGLEQILASLGISPETVVVVYDVTVPAKAALLWWLLVRAGGMKVAILDGGYRRWIEEGYHVTTDATPIGHAGYGALESAGPLPVRMDDDYPVIRLSSGPVFMWQRTLAGGSLKPAREIREYLDSCGIRTSGKYRLDGARPEAAFLVYVLRLLGFGSALCDTDGMLLEVAAH